MVPTGQEDFFFDWLGFCVKELKSQFDSRLSNVCLDIYFFGLTRVEPGQPN
jgi:hypothetical protein